MRLGPTIPALPVRDMAAAVACYRDRFGFAVIHHEGGFAIVSRDDAEIHLWESSDESWLKRASLERPVVSGAESFLSGTASCRVQVDEVDALYAELKAADVLHYRSREGVSDTGWGTREFGTVDADGNLITFFRRVRPRS